ncbi:MAG: transglycosylase domain-containing protein [Leptospiraceae bacterium]|nr:transglycosylase domain-containing protein [Leptospiraceae bacterium]
MNSVDYITPHGSFVCPKCGSRSKLSKLPTEPGVYKITCYSCKHQVLHKVEAEVVEKKEVSETKTAVEIFETAKTPTFSFEEGVDTDSLINLDDIASEVKIPVDDSLTNYPFEEEKVLEVKPAIVKSKAIDKPLWEVKKVAVPVNETPPPKELKKSKLDTMLYYLPPIVKNKFVVLPSLAIILFLLFTIIPFSIAYKEAKEQLPGLLLELGKNKPSKILDRNGEIISEIFQKKTGSTKLKEYPPALIEIILNVEDKNFYSHKGIDLLAMFRATYINLINFRYNQGASTITQQLARILIDDRRKSISRKFKEASVALAIESEMTKDQILEAYLNQVYLGHGAFGMENASLYYFNKNLQALNVMEMVVLSSLASAPNKYSPFKNPEKSKKRIKQILTSLVNKKIISNDYSSEVVDKFFSTLKEPPYSTVFGGRYDAAPYVTEHVREILKSIDQSINIYDIGGYTIQTTLIKQAQEIIPYEVKKHLDEIKKRNKVRKVKVKGKFDKLVAEKLELQAAIIGIDPRNGEVLFMHGGGSEFTSENQFNRAIQMRRQTGSAIKPVIYSAAIDLGLIDPATRMLDAPIVFKNSKGAVIWSPDNFGQVYEGEISIREALLKSKNTIAVQIGEKLGIHNIEKYFTKYFFFDPTERAKRFRADLSVSLGSLEISPLEMASAFSNFANDGVIHRPHLIKKILNKEGKQIFNYLETDEFGLKVPLERRVVESDTAEVMASLMKGSAGASGLRSSGYTGEVIGKTGTTNDYIDAWFVGAKARLSMAIWIGYDDPTYGMGNGGMGASLAAPLWGKVGKKLAETKLVNDEKMVFSKRASWTTICEESGLLVGNECKDTISEIFRGHQKPKEVCKITHGQQGKEMLKKIFQ